MKAHRFFKSLRAAGSDASVVVFANLAIAAPLRNLFGERYNVSVIGYKHIPSAYHNDKFAVSSLRYTFYRLLLEKLPASVELVMFSDIFDVVFQADPFAYVDAKLCAGGSDSSERVSSADAQSGIVRKKKDAKSFVVAEEISRLGVGDASADGGLNQRWIQSCVPNLVRDGQLWESKPPVQCSGTLFGLRNAMYSYAVDMDDLQRLQRKDVLFSEDFQCSKVGLDQGAHNFLMLTTFRSDTLAENVHDGRFLTISGYANFTVDATTSAGFLLNDKGERFVVLHQVNRCPSSAVFHHWKSGAVIPPAQYNCSLVNWPWFLGEEFSRLRL